MILYKLNKKNNVILTTNITKHPDIREVIQIYCKLFSFLDFSTENIKKHTQQTRLYASF